MTAIRRTIFNSMKYLKYITIILLTLPVSIAASGFTVVNESFVDSLTLKQIDSLLKAVKTHRTGKKVTGIGFSKNYHYNTADNSLYLIVVYEEKNSAGRNSQTVTHYYFLNGEPLKIEYGHMKKFKKNRSQYYFSKHKLIFKNEDSKLNQRNPNELLNEADSLKLSAPEFM